MLIFNRRCLFVDTGVTLYSGSNMHCTVASTQKQLLGLCPLDYDRVHQQSFQNYNQQQGKKLKAIKQQAEFRVVIQDVMRQHFPCQ